ncbi:hypothetical protein Pla123a_32760 [Posidoniimonas polymericola]|uniref:Uncharacterized protein n=1 Tax=Posidoniimonas polymericola TaxID=2528002 RepID=A0A5C5YHA0_9BACT|nr:hypothetical protein [Posidoniimonas polymericola]TWT74453.1 hypothetical protein Pla123a_32760 [Posidoniimonas polymericola]
MDDTTTPATPLGACCLNCATPLTRRQPSLDACPQCGGEFNWQDEGSWSDSYWGTRAFKRQLGAAGAVLTCVFAVGAVESGSLSWVIAFVLAGLITGKLAHASLR